MTVAIAAAIGVAGWRLWPSDARRIRQKLDAIEATINERPKDGVGQLTRTLQLAKFVTDDVVLDPGRGAGAIQGRERLLALASQVRNDDPVTLSFAHVMVDVTGEGRASAYLTATITRQDDRTGGEDVDAREVELEFRRTDDWRIVRITLTDAPENPSS